ncbi:MAG: serine/threonine-protein kinase [Longimicrobiales bacterium]
MPLETQSRLAAELAPDFEVLRLLGEGAMAHVYLARETALQRLVAIKVLRDDVVRDETARKRFIREGRSAAKISHNNVTAVYRVGTLEEETPYIVMEHVEGRNLSDALQAEGALDMETAGNVLRQLASALAAAHAVGIIHRDVKPANVLREKDSDRVVLTDFGIAGILESGGSEATRLTKVGQLLGDPRYMSPEQLLGEPLTHETDVYSLGILGHELLTLRGPYDAKSKVDMATAHLRQDPRPVTELRPDADPQLSELLQRCLAKKPEHRPRASEVVQVLERLATDTPPVTPAGASASPATPTLISATGQIPVLRGFLEELGRRHVFKVAVVYILVSFAVFEGAGNVLESLRLPAAAYDVLVALMLGAFPVVLWLSWVFDITRQGIQRTRPIDSEKGDWKLRLVQVSSLVLSLVAALAIGWWILGS